MRSRNVLAIGTALTLALGATACGGDGDGGGATGSGQEAELSGTITIDGSSTVFPFAQAAAELFQEEQPEVQITVGQSGTGGGFEKFCAGETDISDASRPIKDEEAQACEEAGIGFDQVAVANDGISVVANRSLEVDCLTTDQLQEVWNKGSKVGRLSDVDPSLPSTELSLYGPGTDSGTFDYFTEQINGEEGATRDDYQASEDDNQLVQGVAGDAGGLGYFGFSYYEQSADRLRLVAIDAGDGCVKPSTEAIQDGSYKPLSRQIYMYPSNKALARPEVKAFMDFIIENEAEIAEAAKLVPLTDAQIEEARQALQRAAQGGAS